MRRERRGDAVHWPTAATVPARAASTTVAFALASAADGPVTIATSALAAAAIAAAAVTASALTVAIFAAVTVVIAALTTCIAAISPWHRI